MRNDYYNYIKKNVRIQDVCQKLGIPVYRQGSVDMCRCPFHDDNTPSMAIYDDHVYCHACHKRWDNLNLVGEKLDLDFDRQVEWMEKNFPELLSEKTSKIKDKEKVFARSGYEIAYKVYEDMSEEEDNALKQYAENRKFEKDFLAERGIFFAKGKKIKNRYALGEDENIEEKGKLENCQILIKQPWQIGNINDHYADYYANDGIIFTIRDRKQRIQGFAQRVLGNQKPKYKFTKRLPKKTILYRIDEFENRIRKEKKDRLIDVYLVEGLFDALQIERLGGYALAVMGSQLTKTQTVELESILQEHQRPVSIHIFMDNDESGQKGNLQTLRNLWSRKFFRKCYIDIIVPLQGKDPDEWIRMEEKTNIKKYLPFEYLIYNFLPDREDEEAERVKDTKESFEKLSIEKKILCLSRTTHWLSQKYWTDIFGIYATSDADNNDYFLSRIKAYIGEAKLEDSSIVYERADSFQFQLALQVAHTSYEREALPLDELTWRRIQACADAFFSYFREVLQRGNTLNIPLLTMQFPKKTNEERKKSIYIHERLILQQYVLNEMLGEGQNGYEYYVPAVRYNKENNSIYTTTGNGVRETVSFAYQIDMEVLLRDGNTNHGMFRNYYGCWKAYIQYIQDGIQKLDSDRIYRIKLDIRKFYDNIPQYCVRRVVFPALLEALRADSERFLAFREKEIENDVNALAERVTDWILGELFEKQYYDSENGIVTEKEEALIGIPQGPNLSAYIANIILFDMDTKVLKMVDEVNESAKEGKIIIRYARYVDDMIIVSTDADALLEMKDLISSELYDMGLLLSPKTDREDGVSKKEALSWTTDQKGGLGVSAVFDFPDDTLEDMLDEFDACEVTDRRSALKLLESALFAVDKEALMDKTYQEHLLKILFQTEQIRFTDMVRIAELLLVKISAEDEAGALRNMYDKFIELWTFGKKSSPKDSLFWEEGIELFTFIEGCNKVLKRKVDSVRAKERFDLWRNAKKAIQACWQTGFLEKAQELLETKRILRKNQWILKLRITEIQCRLRAEGYKTTGNCKVKEHNVFSNRWQYALLEQEKEFSFEPIPGEKEEELVGIFHYSAFYLGRVSNKGEYEEIRRAIWQSKHHIFAQDNTRILSCCLIDWFQKRKEENVEKERIKTTLLTLLNLLRDDVKAEILSELSHYREYMFRGEQEKLKTCLPVVPGVGYPGMIAETISNEDESRIMKRVDFVRFPNINPQNWQEEINHEYPLFSIAVEDGYVDLESLFNQSSQEEFPIRMILRIYKKLSECIQKIQIQNATQSVALSKKNVFVKKGVDSEEISIILYFYLLPRENIGSGVLLSEGTGRFAFRPLHELGSFFWEAGYLLKDVCRFDTLRLKYENDEIKEEKADQIKMMEYTFHRLTGESVNVGNAPRSIHSYERSVERAIKRTEVFLSASGHRDVLLEENAAVDSFISQRMRRAEYHYRPAECSYCVAVWAKGYLRKRFDALMNLTKKNGVRLDIKHSAKRRVPKSYLVLADYIETLSDIVNEEQGEEFQGLQVLACGLRSDAVLMQLRMQVLEIIDSLSVERRNQLKKHKEELPVTVLGLEDEQELWLEDCSVIEILDNVLDGKNDKRISKITHLGWLVLLEWVLEHEMTDESLQAFSVEIKKWVHMILNDTQNDKLEFPFEEMNSLLELWTCKFTDTLFEFFEKIDTELGIEVKVRRSEFHYQKRGKVYILLDGQALEKPEYFLSYSKLNNGWIDIEQADTNSDKKVFSQSIRKGKTVGLSVVEVRLGKMLQRAEEQESLGKETETENNEISELNNSLENFEKQENVFSEGEQIILEEGGGNSENRVQETGEIEYKRNEEGLDTDDFMTEIRMWQETSWKQRHSNFTNPVRIALFQFETKSSYYHPCVECCEYKEKSKVGEIRQSCHEFRRRKLLENVLQICESMEVDILLLPEYSVRPETVEFLWRKIGRDKEYHFSVWAGTFRIPWDYKFQMEPFKDLVGKNNYFHAAVLPVIMPESEKVYCSRVKKYPSITLKEDINPTPAMDDNFRPIAERFSYDYSQDGHIWIAEEQARKNFGREGFGDARDSVTELICAELFALSSPGNLLSFADESLRLYCNYGGGMSPQDIESYLEKMMEDIRMYGERISLYRKKGSGKRRPIVLVPACTTRAADYYVLGQANYLGSGANMVFCNGAGELARGGSCFIGQNSWDNEKERKKRRRGIEYEVPNCYHGVYPGIYMQTSDMSGRGGLGSEEQALLVCDLSPDMDKRQPNPETMKHSLEVVAHIPILEERIYGKECIKRCKYAEKSFLAEKILKQQEVSRQDNQKWIRQIYETLKLYDEGSKNSAFDQNPSKVAESLIELGEKYHSEWLKERGKRYLKGYKLFPRNKRAETALDWSYVEIDYKEFLASDGYTLFVPDKDIEKQGNDE